MRTTLHRVISLASAAALLLTIASSCDGTDAGFNTPDNTIAPSDIIDPLSKGYISFEGINLSVEVEDENFNDKKTDGYNTASQAATRSDESDDTTDTPTIDTNNYVVRITKESTGEVVYNKTYAEAAAEVAPLTLSAGYYTLYVSSTADELPSTAWGEEGKIYASTPKRLIVGDENVTSLGTVVCYLATIKSQVMLAADMVALFDTSDSASTPLAVTLTYGDASLTYDIDHLYSTEDGAEAQNEANAGYFAPQEGVSEIVVTLTGMYNSAAANETPNYIKINWEQTITKVKAAQSRLISIKFDNYDSGNIQISFDIQNWSYDAPLGVNIFTNTFALALNEDKLFDPDSQVSDAGAPVLALAGGLSADDTYVISSDMLDTDSETYTSIYKATLTPEAGATIKKIYTIVTTENGFFNTALDDAGYTDYTIDLFGGDSNNISDYVTVSENAITKEVNMTLKYSAIAALYNYSGTHTFMVVAIDSNNRTSYTPLTFEVISTAGPQIVWEGGVFGEYTDITNATEENPVSVVLRISSNSGITSLKIKFISPILTVPLLEDIDLAEEIDIANTSTTAMADQLSSLGIPVDGAVYGRTYIEVDISKFMPLIAGFPYSEPAAYTDFEITATDGNGETIETLCVVRYYTDEEIAQNNK